MDRGAAFRRAFHIASPLFLAYYAIPERVSPNLTRLGLALLFIGTAGCIEIARIALGIKLFGMRPYEGQRVSAYAQGLLGLTFGLFVIQDARIVIPVFLGMAWVDPLAAFCRRRNVSRIVPTAAYFVIFVAASVLLRSFSLDFLFLYGIVATASAILMEGPLIPQVDDDLLMQVVPMTVLALFLAVLGPGASPISDFELPVAPRGDLEVPALLARPPVRDPDPLVHLDPLDLVVPEAHGDLLALVVHGLRVAHLPGRAGAAREVARGALLADRELEHVHLGLRAQIRHLHRIALPIAGAWIRTFAFSRGPGKRHRPP